MKSGKPFVSQLKRSKFSKFKYWIMGSLKRGAFIVIEGVDRSGKSTQCQKLVKTLNERNIKSELLNFPDRTTPIGQVISEYLKNSDYKLNDHAIHLLFTANRWENMERMTKLLHEGVTLIVDRYSYSGIAFSSVKKNMDFNWCTQPENGLLKPDLVFLLDLPQKELINRPGFGDERYENSTIQTKVAKLFRELSSRDDNWEIVDADNTVQDVHDTLLKRILEKVDEVGQKPFKYLNFQKK